MLRRLFSFILVIFCAGTLAANAQFLGGGVTSQQTTDCSSPANASSPACMGGATNPYGMGQESFPGGYGSGAYGQGVYGQGVYGQGTYPQQQPGVANPMEGRSGINGRVPTYMDQIPYGNQRNLNPGSSGTATSQSLTEFQHAVATAVGAVLPIFGADLFSDISAPFAPIDRTPVTSDYVVGPGDQLLIRIWGQVNFNAHSTVDRAGDIYIPQAGNVHVAGLHFEQLNGYLKSQLGRVFRNFDLSVNMGQLRSIQIYVVGNARNPGSYTVSSLSTLVNALFFSGGPSEQGSMRRIELRRGGKTITIFDFYDLLIEGDKSHDAPLLPGDVIYIPPIGPQVAVAGSVHVPAIYELKGTETAEQAIAVAGGLSTMAAKQDAQLDRTNSQGLRQTIEVALDAAGLAMPLRDGDIMRIPSMVQRFDRTVTLRGNVANPGRYSWKPGMRILDIIPDQASLETRGYWHRRIALGLPAPEYTPLISPYQAAVTQPEISSNGPSKQATPAAGNPSGQTPNALANFGSSPYSTNGISVANAEEGSLHSPQGTLGSYYPPGDRYSQGLFPVKNEILRTAPSIDWSYAAIERTDPHTLATSIVPFSLGKAVLDHDPLQNMELEPGDVITVFSTADIHVPQVQQVKYVRLEGEVVHGGIYSVEPGETLRDLIRRAGGLTPNAYLYGSEFLRESTRRLQQARLDEFVNSTERDIQIASANTAGSIVNPAGAAALTTSVQSQQQLVSTLRKMRATGRIVLDLTPYSRGVDALPNLPLEDGDRFIVPVVPSTVNVVGAVYDQNSFLYQRGEHVGDYLKTAGGSTRNADKRHEFVIRADGSVISKQTAGGTVFTGGFSSKLAYPGDTVVVPDNVSKISVLRGLTDWSAVFSQFGLGIASLTLFGL